MFRNIPESRMYMYVIFTSVFDRFDAGLGHVLSSKDEAPRMKRFSLKTRPFVGNKV